MSRQAVNQTADRQQNQTAHDTNGQKVVAITGASNGMGLEAAKYFAARGWQVFAGARRVEKIPTGPGITALRLDVTDSRSNHAFIKAITSATGGRIDLLINNAGYGEYGPAEEVPMARVRQQFETNFFGAVELAQLVLPSMRRRHSGRIINISSIGGDIYMPLGAYYHATKAALQQWSDTLDLEVRPWGIRSIIIQPGGTQSAWADIAMENAKQNLAPNSPYSTLVGQVRKLFADLPAASEATSADLARVFYRAGLDRRAKRRYFNSLGDRAIVEIGRVLPGLYRFGLQFALTQLSKRG